MKYFEQLTVEDLKSAFLEYCRETQVPKDQYRNRWVQFYAKFKNKCSIVERV